jgi:hypothetical protein
MWANIEEFKGHGRIESMVTLINDLVGHVRRAREAGDHLDVRLFQMSLIERGLSIQNRNRT